VSEEAGNVFAFSRDRRGATRDWSEFGLCPECWMTPGLPCRDLRYSTGAHFITEPHPARWSTWVEG
jgi:hypothetical protein